MKKFKQILFVLFWCIASAGLIICLGFVNEEQDALLCKKLEIHVNQDNDLYFVDRIDIARLLKDRGDSIVNQPKKTINVTDIEKALNSHAAISNAEVSMSIDGIVKVDVRQRNPIVRIFNPDGDSYYIDDEGTLMPLSDKYTMKILIVNGDIYEPYAQRYMYSVKDIDADSTLRNASKLDELYAMAKFINSDPFWKAQIHQIYYNNENDMEIVPLAGNQKIIFGDTTSMQEKFNKLMTFYREGLNTTGWWDRYSTINLKFKNQIVCTKK